jgi:hypothetical protein
MNRNLKIGKLARAVKEWRGAYDSREERWIRTPDKSALPRVVRWLHELGLGTQENVEKIGTFKSYRDFDAWLRQQK